MGEVVVDEVGCELIHFLLRGVVITWSEVGMVEEMRNEIKHSNPFGERIVDVALGNHEDSIVFLKLGCELGKILTDETWHGFIVVGDAILNAMHGVVGINE